MQKYRIFNQLRKSNASLRQIASNILVRTNTQNFKSNGQFSQQIQFARLKLKPKGINNRDMPKNVNYALQMLIGTFQIISSRSFTLHNQQVHIRLAIIQLQVVIMQNVCESVIRCLCSCLISKTQVKYSEVNEEHHEFIKLGELIDQEHRNHLPQEKEYLSESTATTVVNKLANFLEEEKSGYISQHQQFIDSSPNIIGSNDSPIHPLEKQSSKTYTDVIAEEHPYYDLFKQKLALLANIFEVPAGACSAEPDALYPLRMYCYQEGKLNSFKYFFRLPTDYHTYEAISNDFDLQRQFDPNIEDFRKVLETPGGDAKLIYLSYKKVLIMSSRDFEYVRYTFKKGDEYWNICISDMSREEVKGKVRGEMLLTATRIIEHQGEIEVSVSSTTDMKIPIKLEIAKHRGFAEIRKYLDKVYQHVKDEQAKSII